MPTHSTITSSAITPTSTDGGARPAGYGYEWARFTDWCAATDRPALPAHPITLAEFLDEHPAPAATQRRRLAAITQAHTAHGHPSPARATAIRALLNPPGPDSGRDVEQRRETVTAVIAALPTSGWPHGLFGRRDSLLLLLTQHAGLTSTPVSRLRRGDLRTDPTGQLLITTGPYDITALPASDDPRSCPGCVYRRWAWIGEVTDRYPSVRTLRDALRRASPITTDSPHRCTAPGPRAAAATTAAAPLGADQPLFTPIDSWGYQPLQPTGLSAKTIGQLTTAHLRGNPATHRNLPEPLPVQDADGSIDLAIPATPLLSPTEAAARAAAAHTSRQYDHDRLTQASTALASIDSRVQDLLERTLALLDAAQAPVQHR